MHIENIIKTNVCSNIFHRRISQAKKFWNPERSFVRHIHKKL